MQARSCILQKNSPRQTQTCTDALPTHVPSPRLLRLTLLTTLAAAVATPNLATDAGAAEKHKRKKPKRKAMMAPSATVYDFEMDALNGNILNPDGASLGATPGGAQDIGYARDRIEAGQIPHPNAFTPEGLFSEHDLPLAHAAPCQQRLCVGGGSMPVHLLAQPEVTHLAQLGFSSNLTKSFRRPPITLVAVVDRSGSMSGQPLELVRKSLRTVVSQMRPDDRLAIVGYHSTAHIVIGPTRANKTHLLETAINSLHSEGATALEDGLALGFSVAHTAARGRSGTTRVMLFTDERPNVGRTDAAGFMSMAQRASRQGIGLTTIGVSTHFGAELAQKVSSVRGGNLFFFPDVDRMQEKFRDEFDTMVTELAYDLQLKVTPRLGMKIAGVYGIPGKALTWKGKSLEMTVSTIFLSRKKGAIYVAFAPEANFLPGQMLAAGANVGSASLQYFDRHKNLFHSAVDFDILPPNRVGHGLRRGALLVNQVTTLKRATELHHDQNDQEGAYQLVHALSSLMRHNGDPTLASERSLVYKLEQTLARLSGHAGEAMPDSQPEPDRVSGLPPRAAVVPANYRHNFDVKQVAR